MTSTIDITMGGLLTLYALLIVPVVLMLFFRVPLIKNTAFSAVRMSVQLALVGLYLGYLFRLNNPVLTISWVLVMIGVANINILDSSSLKKRPLFLITGIGLSLSTFAVTGLFVLVVIRPTPMLDAAYYIPITGMVLGNCLRSNIVALERFFSGIRKNEKEFTTYLLLGASVQEAAIPHIRQGLNAALAPTLSTMATMGIVSLPGMMTGQILGGSSPLVAVKYQMAIMIAIFVSTAISTAINLSLCTRVAFDEYGRLRKELLAG